MAELKKVEAESEATDVDTGGSAQQTMPPREWVKRFIAPFFVASFVVLLGIMPLVLLLSHTLNVEGYKDVVLTLGSILGGPLGIIINNYFKEGGDT